MSFKKFIFKSLRTLFRAELVNADKEPSGGVLVCSNHLSLVDPIVIVSSFKNPVCFMAKKELFKIPLVGSIIKLFGAFPVDRGNVDLNAMKKAISLLEDGNMVGMFPQGTRYAGVKPRETDVKSGAGMIVVRAHIDVLPVAVITKNNKFGLFKKNYVVIGDVIKYESFNNPEKTREEFNRISAEIFDKICDLHEKYSYLAEGNNGK
ncbi:MAG: 1-acyl-sn-glycerol-3-phosphate acyltransferase [Clostridia bacterium]|nr:1-acyl-sn-glycerol-3-phosphate acyltransferase [Clostridia bacterium]